LYIKFCQKKKTAILAEFLLRGPLFNIVLSFSDDKNNDSAKENELKWIEIFFYPNAYFNVNIFLGFNWIQLDSIGCNWIEKLHFLFKILN